jgi:hypothetical protein
MGAVSGLEDAAGRQRPPRRALRTTADLRLQGVALLSALSSIAPLLLQWGGWVRMPFTVSFVTLPGLVLLCAMTVWSGRSDHVLLANRLLTGFVAGAAGLVVYDATRLAVQEMLPVQFDAFRSMKVFGTLMTGLPTTSLVGQAAGWSYHITNGLTFGVIYALVAGPARWPWGFAWGLLLEIAMVVVYPAIYHPSSRTMFLSVSIAGHAAYGATLGVVCQRCALPRRRLQR